MLLKLWLPVAALAQVGQAQVYSNGTTLLPAHSPISWLNQSSPSTSQSYVLSTQTQLPVQTVYVTRVTYVDRTLVETKDQCICTSSGYGEFPGASNDPLTDGKTRHDHDSGLEGALDPSPDLDDRISVGQPHIPSPPYKGRPVIGNPDGKVPATLISPQEPAEDSPGSLPVDQPAGQPSPGTPNIATTSLDVSMSKEPKRPITTLSFGNHSTSLTSTQSIVDPPPSRQSSTASAGVSSSRTPSFAVKPILRSRSSAVVTDMLSTTIESGRQSSVPSSGALESASGTDTTAAPSHTSAIDTDPESSTLRLITSGLADGPRRSTSVSTGVDSPQASESHPEGASTASQPLESSKTLASSADLGSSATFSTGASSLTSVASSSNINGPRDDSTVSMTTTSSTAFTTDVSTTRPASPGSSDLPVSSRSAIDTIPGRVSSSPDQAPVESTTRTSVPPTPVVSTKTVTVVPPPTPTPPALYPECAGGAESNVPYECQSEKIIRVKGKHDYGWLHNNRYNGDLKQDGRYTSFSRDILDKLVRVLVSDCQMRGNNDHSRTAFPLRLIGEYDADKRDYLCLCGSRNIGWPTDHTEIPRDGRDWELWFARSWPARADTPEPHRPVSMYPGINAWMNPFETHIFTITTGNKLQAEFILWDHSRLPLRFYVRDGRLAAQSYLKPMNPDEEVELYLEDPFTTRKRASWCPRIWSMDGNVEAASEETADAAANAERYASAARAQADARAAETNVTIRQLKAENGAFGSDMPPQLAAFFAEADEDETFDAFTARLQVENQTLALDGQP